MLSDIRVAVMGMEGEVHRLEIYLRDRINICNDGLDVRVRMREMSRLIPKSLARLTGWMEAPLPRGRVDFRGKKEKNKSSLWDTLSYRSL